MLGDSEIETILKRMDRLTQEEARMTMAQTLAVVHGLLNNAKVVMDGDTVGILQCIPIQFEKSGQSDFVK